jgi:hypothetical protein
MANANKEAELNGAGEKTSPAAYVPFRTFISAIESLEHGVPKKIDRTIWRTQSGVTQTQIMMAFRFFDLVDTDDRPTGLLHELVNEKEQRKVAMGTVLAGAYARILANDLTKTTPKMLDDEFDLLGVSGDTKRKAVTFFLKAAKFAELPMHPLLAAQVRNTGPRAKNRGSRKISDAGTTTIKVTPNGTPSGVQAANTRSVSLRSGGTVTMAVSYDPFSLSSEDRKFVFDLVDQLNAYAEQHPPDGSEEDEEDES